MDYETPLVRSFAARTLEYIEKQQNLGEDVYEVTQLINSLLGLLIFPQQRFIEAIPKTPLLELEAQGWPSIQIIQGQSECKTLYDLVRYLRNGVAHFNIRFAANQDGQIQGLQIWNYRHGQRNWEAQLSISQLRMIADVFIDTIQDYQ
jgi:hypothetical protein